MARCFISWVAPDMTTILKARDKRHEGAVGGRQDQTARLGHPLKQGCGGGPHRVCGRGQGGGGRDHGAQGPAHDGGDLGLPQVGTPGGGRELRHGRGAHRCLNRSARGRVGTGHWRHSWCSVGGAQRRALPPDCVRDCAQCSCCHHSRNMASGGREPGQEATAPTAPPAASCREGWREHRNTSLRWCVNKRAPLCRAGGSLQRCSVAQSCELLNSMPCTIYIYCICLKAR